jgi:quercetin dioxygenase-like cupin family protein
MAQARISSGRPTSVRPLADALVTSRTTALLKASQLELVRLVLPAGRGLPEHSAPGEITVQCIEGCVDFTTPTGVHRLLAGDLIHLEAGQPHALNAVESASLLLTICLVTP